MMETDIEKMYMDLNELLLDICKFLSSDNLKVLSPKDKKLADSLIKRSKTQLQEISKLQEPSSFDEYVDMDGKKDGNSTQMETPFIEEIPTYPYKDLPAKEASQEVKYGLISMKRKAWLLGLEKMKKVYAAIHNNFLLVYCSDRDLKPMFTFNLKNFEAKADRDRSNNFELLSTFPDQKVYYFMAVTPKDMLQWVVQINKCHDTVFLKDKGIDIKERDLNIENDDVGEHYDCVIPTTNNNQKEEETTEEDIYLELDDMVQQDPRNNTTIPSDVSINVRPPLPGRRPVRNAMAIPVAPPVVRQLSSAPQSDESIASYDDIEIKEDQPDSPHYSDSHGFDDFSEEDEEDCTYESFVHVQNKAKQFTGEKTLPTVQQSTEDYNSPSHTMENSKSHAKEETMSSDATTENSSSQLNVNNLKSQLNQQPNNQLINESVSSRIGLVSKLKRQLSQEPSSSNIQGNIESSSPRSLVSRLKDQLTHEIVLPNLHPTVESSRPQLSGINKLKWQTTRESVPTNVQTTPESPKSKFAPEAPAIPVKPKVKDKPLVAKKNLYKTFT